MMMIGLNEQTHWYATLVKLLLSVLVNHKDISWPQTWSKVTFLIQTCKTLDSYVHVLVQFFLQLFQEIL